MSSSRTIIEKLWDSHSYQQPALRRFSIHLHLVHEYCAEALRASTARPEVRRPDLLSELRHSTPTRRDLPIIDPIARAQVRIEKNCTEFGVRTTF